MENPQIRITSSLIAKCKSGDRDAFRQLYDLYSKAMYNISIRIVNNAVETEDILQEVFLKAFQDMSRFENEKAFGGWMKKAVINRSIDQVRRRKIAFSSIDQEDLIEENDDDMRCSIEALRLCIQKLPDNYRLVLTLFLFEEQSHREIANALNITEGTSKSLYHRAKLKLLQLLKEHEHES
ncbi:MAG: RNA polymerase sigma factor [Bacteroidia bacterium]